MALMGLMRASVLVACFLLCATSQAAARSFTPGQDAAAESELLGSSAVLGTIACVAGLVCLIVVLFGCSEICNREVAFKDFENDDVFSAEVESPPAMVPSEFTMYPPMESTPDAAGPIVFEALPDPILLKRSTGPAANTRLLRPKVALCSRGRTESEDSLDDDGSQAQQDEVAHKLKLHNLIVNSRNQIPRSQLQYIKELGTGWFGKVLQGEGQKILPGHKKTKVVIQMLKEDSDSSDQLAFLQEGLPYRDVDSPNVLRLLGQCVDTAPYLTILELCPFGDVKTYLRSHRIAMESFNEKGLLLKFACDMAAGLQALNQQGYIHRDFAARNCLLASDLSVKIGDYGLSEETFKEDYYVESDGSSVPIRWLAPETMQVHDDGGLVLRRITKESNVWSFGVTLWEIITFGTLPYSDLSNEHVLRLVIKERSLKPNKPDMPVSHLDRLYELMQLCWSDAPAGRPSLRELRIMMLHLMSNKMTSDSKAFDQKWNQLMPRKPPQVAKVAPQPQQQTPLPTIDAIVEDPLKVNQPQRPTGFETGFAELNPSLLGNAGSLESTPAELPQVHRNGPMTTPLNDLSLDAEFSAINMMMTDPKVAAAGAGDGQQEKVETPANELSLAAEFAQAPSPSDSETGDDVIEIHVEEPGRENPAFEQDTPLSPVKKDDEEIQVVVHSPREEQEGKSSTSTMATESSSSGEFYTSTPVKSEPSSLSSTQNTDQLSSSFYQTALTTQTSTEDEPSILGQRKFAACLQTVVTSFDGDELDPLSFSGSVDEDVFKIPHPSIPEAKEEEEEEEEEEEKNQDETIKPDAVDVFDEPQKTKEEVTPTTEAEKPIAPIIETTKAKELDQSGVENSASPLLDFGATDEVTPPAEKPPKSDAKESELVVENSASPLLDLNTEEAEEKAASSDTEKAKEVENSSSSLLDLDSEATGDDVKAKADKPTSSETDKVKVENSSSPLLDLSMDAAGEEKEKKDDDELEGLTA